MTATWCRRACAPAVLALLVLSGAGSPALALDNSASHPAAAPATGPAAAVSERELGLADALLEYCTKADPSTADGVKVRVSRVTHGASAAELARVRAGSGYIAARRAESDFLSKVDPRNSARACGGTKKAAPPPRADKAK